MDPERVRAYLQVACAGLGFDIGEVWWTQNENGSSTVAAIEEKVGDSTALSTGVEKGKLRFVQLYTSKSFANRRSQLVNPPEEDDENRNGNGTENSLVTTATQPAKRSTLEEHVLSPLLVDAISKTAQVVWANTKKQEGLLGRSDIRLSTAVGMPVAVDNNGNMCVVVMFSPNNIQSTDDAMEYLQSISLSATSSSIPSLLPAFDTTAGLTHVPHHHPTNQPLPLLASGCLADGVTTRFVSLDDNRHHERERNSSAEMHGEHELTAAPKDCFGIPMLPSFAELSGNPLTEANANTSLADVFDEASYGVWSTIMETSDPDLNDSQTNEMGAVDSGQLGNLEYNMTEAPDYAVEKPLMAIERKERLEEFTSAFLDVSVFDAADVWVPAPGQSGYLGNVTSITSTESNQALNEFKRMSESILIKYWSGAVGRAFSSGNPVWSTNPSVFVDAGRADMFSKVKIQTALAVPVFSSAKSTTPAFVLCYYSFVRTGSVPFVLKFVQQALRLLWEGLDKVEPHESVGPDMWRDIAPADLGEMAADVEMHQHFMVKKRPRSESIISAYEQTANNMDSSLAVELEAMEVRSGVPAARSIYVGKQTPPMGPSEAAASPEMVSAVPSLQLQTYESIQSHIHNAVRSVTDGLYPAHQHITTNEQGSKRAHVVGPLHTTQTQEYQQSSQSSSQPSMNGSRLSAQHIPLPMPRPLPLPNQILMHSLSVESQGQSQQMHSPSMPPTHSQNIGMSSAQLSYNQMSNQPSYGQHVGMQGTQPSYGDQQGGMQASQLNYINQQGGMATHPSYTQYGGMSAIRPETSQLYDQSFGDSQGVSPIPIHSMSVPIPSPISPVPTNQISATGISFPQPLLVQSNVRNTVSMMNGNGQGNPSPAVMSSIQYCLTTNGDNHAPGVSTNGKACRIVGCNDPSIARRPYCVHHSGTRLCEHPTCSKCAQGSTRFCIAHGGGRRCTHPGCDKGARDKFFCAAHGGGKRCKADDCNKSAVGGSQLCTAHGGGRRCSIDGCDKSAQSSTKFCVKHGGGKKCCHPTCEKVARGRTEYCAAHGGGVRCKLEGCNRVAIGKLQLCRAHGGGTRPRSRKNDPLPTSDAMAGMAADTAHV